MLPRDRGRGMGSAAGGDRTRAGRPTIIILIVINDIFIRPAPGRGAPSQRETKDTFRLWFVIPECIKLMTEYPCTRLAWSLALGRRMST